MDESTTAFLWGVSASFIAGAGAGLGALPLLLRQRWSPRAHSLMLAVAAGIMLAATVFSLLEPATDLAAEQVGSFTGGVAVVAAAIVAGALAIWVLHSLLPHEHFLKGREGAEPKELERSWLFVFAIGLHNFPEGLSVGVSWGAGSSTGLPVTVGMLLQNLPEGLAVAAALVAVGYSRGRAIWISFVTGLIEPVGGIVGAGVVSLAQTLLPWALAFAAGAMLFVISGEIIPETHRRGVERSATFALVLGFVVMMIIDSGLG